MSNKVKNIVCVGAGQSVGLVIARSLAQSGHRVHIIDRQLDAQAATADNIRASTADVSDPEAVAEAFRQAFAWLGHVDALVNTVHSGGPRAAVEAISLEEWNNVVGPVLTGAFLCARQVIPSMKARRSGVIIHFSTCSTRTAVPMRTPYVAAKAGLEGFTRCLARELGPFNIRCNAILPGMIDNERLRAVIARNAQAQGMAPEELEREFLGYVSLRRKIAMPEFADFVKFLIDDRSSGITGQLLELGGNIEWEAP